MKKMVHWLFASLLAFPAVVWAAVEPLTVAVSILPQQTFVEKIGGRHVKVVVLVPPGKSPATHEPTPQQVEAVAAAKLYFRIGVPFETAWLPRLAQVAPAARVIDLREGLKLRPVDLPPGETAQPGGASDPHVWLSPPLVIEMAARIREALSAARPEAAAEFAENHARFVAELKALDAEIRARLAGKQGRTFMVFHPSWGYFADAYGLKQLPIEAGWKEPGPQTLQRLIEAARAQGIRVIFVQKQFSQREAATLAGAIGGEVVAVDPLAPDYVDNLRLVADVFARALR
ncbi:MAG: zinc ABC transporter substrate-binding protein [Rhodocyclaceae bacterium]|nr:zinc ABC transporter substrate-binding protein [Rhodocyclaceae bacterium]